MTPDERRTVEFEARMQHISIGRAVASILAISIVASLIASLL